MTDAKQALEVVERLNGAIRSAGQFTGNRYVCDDVDIPMKDAKLIASLLSSLAEENERLRGALEFYASTTAWRTATVFACGHHEDSKADRDGGKRARQALATHPAQPEGEGHER